MGRRDREEEWCKISKVRRNKTYLRTHEKAGF